MNACTTSAMNAWPMRTSPCGCSSPEVPLSSSGERRVDEREGGQRAGLAALRSTPARGPSAPARRAPQRRHRDVGVEVAVGDARLLSAAKIVVSGKPAPAREQRVVLHPVGLSRVHVLAVRVGRRQQRAEEAVVGGERLGGAGDERAGPARCSSRSRTRRSGRAGSRPSCRRRAGAAAVPGVVGVRVRAALEVRGEPVGRVLRVPEASVKVRPAWRPSAPGSQPR